MSALRRLYLKIFGFIPSVRAQRDEMVEADYYIYGGYLKERLAQFLNSEPPVEKAEKPVSKVQAVEASPPNLERDGYFSSDAERNSFLTYTH